MISRLKRQFFLPGYIIKHLVHTHSFGSYHIIFPTIAYHQRIMHLGLCGRKCKMKDFGPGLQDTDVIRENNLLKKAVEYAIGVLEQSAQRNVETAGASQILKMPEYRDVDKAHDLVTFLVDNKEELPVPDDGAPLKILIGPENVNEALKETSVVVASYDIGDGMRGLVGVVGPTRMDYATVTARLSYFADSLTRMFGKNELPPKEEDKE